MDPSSAPLQPPYQPPSDPLAAQPIAPLGTMPDPATPPPTKRNNFIALISVLLFVVVLFVSMGAVLYARSHPNSSTSVAATTTTGPSQAQLILAHVSQSGLQDTTFTISGNQTISMSFEGQPENDVTKQAGTGTITENPARMHTIITSATTIFGRTTKSTLEEIIDGTTIYIKDSLLAKDPQKPWTKIDVGALAGLGSGMSGDSYLNFSSLSAAQIVGEESINGKKVWHIHANLGALSSSAPSGPLATLTGILDNQQGVTNVVDTEDVWVYEDTNFPAKISQHMSETIDVNDVLGTPSATATPNPDAISTITMDQTILFTKWNTGVTITPPPDSEVADGPGL